MVGVRRLSPLLLALLFLGYWGVLGEEEAVCDVGGGEEATERAEDDTWEEFIVRFRDYRLQAEHRGSVEAIMDITSPKMHKSWRWIDRHNPASKYPTDFGLVRLPRGFDGVFSSRLERLPSYRDMSRNGKYKRKLKGIFGMGSDDTNDDDAGPHHRGENRKGKRFTKSSYEVHRNVTQADSSGSIGDFFRRKLNLFGTSTSITQAMNAKVLWEEGLTGRGVRVGVFDTGIMKNHPSIKNIRERTNWTHEDNFEDGVGHGTFVAGVIGSTKSTCLGFAQDFLLTTFKVFTSHQESYTSWFLDAFNYAMLTDIEVINISIGGPDISDFPFVDKVSEVVANGIIVIAANGNDGPFWGTANNPSDQMDVVGIGGIDYTDKMADFSSRGMTLYELPDGYGRAKPDVVAYGENVQGLGITSGCTSLSGTSVSSPVVAGAVTLIVSVLNEEERKKKLNPGSLKQMLHSTAKRIKGASIFEQGAGKLDVPGAAHAFATYMPKATLFPEKIDLTDCPYMHPYCAQSLYPGAMPTVVNATIVNGMGARGHISELPVWKIHKGKGLSLSFTYSEEIWPYSGFLAVHFHVNDNARPGTVEGMIKFTVESPPVAPETEPRTSVVEAIVKAKIVAKPPRKKRILWDQFHNIRYPPMFVPRDDLNLHHDTVDWHGDHPHTNFLEIFQRLRYEGYFVEVLGSPFTCFDASEYGHLLIVDSEEEFFKEEIEKIAKDVKDSGLNLIVLSEWHNSAGIDRLRYWDENTRTYWEAAIGGGNVPALNDLLEPLGAGLGDQVVDGTLNSLDVKQKVNIDVHSAGNINKWPVGGRLASYTKPNIRYGKERGTKLFGVGSAQVGKGSIQVLTDSTCLDGSEPYQKRCYDLLISMLRYASDGTQYIKDDFTVPADEFASSALFSGFSYGKDPPVRKKSSEFAEYSKVVGRSAVCGMVTPYKFHDNKPLAPLDNPFVDGSIEGMIRHDEIQDNFAWELFHLLEKQGDFKIDYKDTASSEKSDENWSASDEEEFAKVLRDTTPTYLKAQEPETQLHKLERIVDETEEKLKQSYFSMEDEAAKFASRTFDIQMKPGSLIMYSMVGLTTGIFVLGVFFFSTRSKRRVRKNGNGRHAYREV